MPKYEYVIADCDYPTEKNIARFVNLRDAVIFINALFEEYSEEPYLKYSIKKRGFIPDEVERNGDPGE